MVNCRATWRGLAPPSRAANQPPTSAGPAVRFSRLVYKAPTNSEADGTTRSSRHSIAKWAVRFGKDEEEDIGRLLCLNREKFKGRKTARSWARVPSRGAVREEG